VTIEPVGAREGAVTHDVSGAAPSGPPAVLLVDRPSALRTVLQILLAIGAIVLALWALHRIAAVVLVLIAASLFAYVVAPVVQMVQRPIRFGGRTHRMPRAAAIGLVYLLMAASVGTSIVMLLPLATQQASDAVARVPAYAQSFAAWEHGWSRYYERLKIPKELRAGIDQSVEAAGASLTASLQAAVPTVAERVSGLPWLVMIPVLAFFLLKDAASIRRLIVVDLPFRYRLRGHRLFEELNATMAAYVRAQLLACLLVGTICGVGFALIGVPYAVLLGVLAGVLEFIPMVGPLVLATIACLAAVAHAPMTAAWTIGFLATLRVIEDYVIYPRLIGRGLELHPLAVIVGVMAGAELDGVAGMFLAVPAVATATVVYRHWMMWREADVAPTPAATVEPIAR
jgi:predicted PurR-regulated permease PerM